MFEKALDCFFEGEGFWSLAQVHQPRIISDKGIVVVKRYQEALELQLLVDALVEGGQIGPLGSESTHAKKSLFWFPLGTIMRWLGGIPVDRSSSHGMVEDLARRFREASQLVIGITPEGTRSGVSTWKSGFARIAAAAQVPVLPAIVNYEEKMIYIQPLIAADESAEAILEATRAAASVGCPRSH